MPIVLEPTHLLSPWPWPILATMHADSEPAQRPAHLRIIFGSNPNGGWTRVQVLHEENLPLSDFFQNRVSLSLFPNKRSWSPRHLQFDAKISINNNQYSLNFYPQSSIPSQRQKSLCTINPLLLGAIGAQGSKRRMWGSRGACSWSQWCAWRSCHQCRTRMKYATIACNLGAAPISTNPEVRKPYATALFLYRNLGKLCNVACTSCHSGEPLCSAMALQRATVALPQQRWTIRV
jgi:hypothetical protein